jgi:predicted cupin superfamily sugar epimerase
MSKRHDSDFVGRRNFLKRATFVGAAVVAPGLAANAQRPSKNSVTQRPNELRTDEVRNLLKLEPHATCGFVRVTFMSKERIALGGLPAPFAAGRPVGSALYFMVTPGAPVRLHRIRNDQLYHYYLGDPLEVLMLRVDGTTERVVVGPDLRGGQVVQLLIPGNTFHTARVIGRRRWFLGGSTEWPGVEPVDVEIGDVEALAAKYPQVAADLRTFPVPVKE